MMFFGLGVSFLLGIFTTDIVVSSILSKTIADKTRMVEKFRLYYLTLNLWLDMKQNGIRVDHYLKSQSIKTVAIYGMKELGDRLYAELKDTDVHVSYVIDKNPVLGDFELYHDASMASDVDLIIVTAEYDYYEIKKTLSERGIPVMSLLELISSAFQREI